MNTPKEIQNPNFKVLPILIDNTEVPTFLNDKLYFQLNNNNLQTAIKKIIKSIISIPENKNIEHHTIPFNQFQMVKLVRKSAGISMLLLFIGTIIIVFRNTMGFPKPVQNIGIVIIMWGLLILVIYQRFENAFRKDRALLNKIEEIGGYVFPFDIKWRLQYKAGKSNKLYKNTLLLETITVVLMLFFMYYLMDLLNIILQQIV